MGQVGSLLKPRDSSRTFLPTQTFIHGILLLFSALTVLSLIKIIQSNYKKFQDWTINIFVQLFLVLVAIEMN